MAPVAITPAAMIAVLVLSAASTPPCFSGSRLRELEWGSDSASSEGGSGDARLAESDGLSESDPKESAAASCPSSAPELAVLPLSSRYKGLISRLLSQEVGRDSLLAVAPNSGLEGVTGEAMGEDLRNPLGEDPKRNCRGTAV